MSRKVAEEGKELERRTEASQGRSSLRERLARRDFTVTVEMEPPRGASPAETLEKVSRLAGYVDAVNVADCPMANLRMSPIAVAHLIQEELGVETIFHLTCRDRNLLGLQAELLGAAALGVSNILALTGDRPERGDHPTARGVFDLDSTGLIRLAVRLNRGESWAGQKLASPTRFFIGTVANPSQPDLSAELERLRAKVEAGAEFVQTQPVFDLEQVARFQREAAVLGLPVLYGILPLKSYRNAVYLSTHVPGIFIPQEVLDRLRRRDSPQEGVVLARELLSGLRRLGVHGAHIFPMGDPGLALAVLTGAE